MEQALAQDSRVKVKVKFVAVPKNGTSSYAPSSYTAQRTIVNSDSRVISGNCEQGLRVQTATGGHVLGLLFNLRLSIFS